MTSKSEDTQSPEATAGETLLHPLVLGAVLTLVINDHVLKRLWPSVVTGKLSDVAGLVFFPLFLQALWEVGASLLKRPVRHSPRVLRGCALLTAGVFSAVQLSADAAELYRVGLGAMQWPFVAVFEWLRGHPSPVPWRVHLTQDTTDLWALPALFIPLWLFRPRKPAE